MLSIFQLPCYYKYRLVFLVAFMMLFFTACKKEATLEESNEDVNYFVRTDNPADPVDHALFQFYEQTGIAGFYNDTIHRKLISRPEEKVERYDYTRLALTYALQGEVATGFTYLSNKNFLPELLPFMQNQVLTALPSNESIPSLFFIDSFYKFSTPLDKKIEYGWTAIYGLNTVGVVVKDVSIMNDSEKEVYRASILAGIAEKWLLLTHASVLQTEFYQITRNLLKTVNTSANYVFLPYELLVPVNRIPQPEAMGLLYHPLALAPNIPKVVMPTESIDIRAFMTAAFLYSEEDFQEKYDAYPAVIQKFKVVRELLLKTGFKLQ
jgi:hypothetical protein